MKNATELIKERFKNKEFKKAYYRSAPFYRLADELLQIRKKRGLTQKELAEVAGTTQAVVSRLENASVKASLESVVKFADALDAVVNINLVPLEEVEEFQEVSDFQPKDVQKPKNYFYFYQLHQGIEKREMEEVLSGIDEISGEPVKLEYKKRILYA